MKLLCKISVIATALALIACIKNDIPYPVVELDITEIAVEGTSGECTIDRLSRTVVIPLAETTDIRNVRINGIKYTEGAKASNELNGVFDMRYPQYVTLSLYQDYEWKITATQIIDRRFKVIGQIGETEWDIERHIAKVHRRDDYGLDTVTVTALRFGPEPEYSWDSDRFTRPVDFSNTAYPPTVDVECFNRSELWRLFVEPKEIGIEFTRAVAGSEVIWLRALGVDGAQTGFRYRIRGESEWKEAEQGWYTSTGGTIEAILRHLQPDTEYEVVGYAKSDSGDKESEIRIIKTGALFELPNASFEEWSVTDDTYYPYSSIDKAWWGTGNPGSKIAGINISTPFSGTLHEGATGKCAQLWSQKASVMGIGKFAAGNCFVGDFAGVVGTNGLVRFGRPYTLRPTSLKGWVKYELGVIDCVPTAGTGGKTPGLGENDEGIIYFTLGDWDYTRYGGTAESPVLVDTRNEATFFNSNNEGIIAYGEIRFTASCDWYQFEIPLEYRDFDRTPTHIIIVCTSSRYGDYFVGSKSSIMWIDDFELCYDYE
ncbi:MAG: PCMD domain-containing protein [Alistipes sp.]